VTLAVGVLTGLLPVLQVRRLAVTDDLKAGARGGTYHRSRMRSALLVLQGALSLVLLVGAATTVAVLHSILPDHWVPLAVIARAQRWGLVRVARVSALASIGHVLASVALAGVIAVVGLSALNG